MNHVGKVPNLPEVDEALHQRSRTWLMFTVGSKKGCLGMDPEHSGFTEGWDKKDRLGRSSQYGIELCPPKGYAEVLISNTYECDLSWKSALYKCNQVKKRSYWI